ncbi:SMI1/KNR4 family protein [Rhodococcus tibetensis]|uniref:SMI1/KNR4 family protein n=1 Tax=Rhodococcus tibetensis TaxID=2965064 RepID=A0ABT1QEI0_9NOCA|nr:SMI1/KNR4 family protein [Rhodococcus sp. FXJ9.536]MCQ4120699.1 SMI1/KNR4 family protein [Rhodococcus sp. FXJ9.536]
MKSILARRPHMRHLRNTFAPLTVLVVAGACSQSPSTGAGETDWWSTAIETLEHEQQAEYERQKDKGHDDAWMLTTPGPPATDADIIAAESRLGMKFDVQYKEWLHHVNGWRFYCGGDSLYALDDIAQDSPKKRNLPSGSIAPS